jgi:hypothetical protein
LVNTHPNIAFAIGYVSRFLSKPHEDHMLVVKHILGYIAGTLNWGVHLKKGSGKTMFLGFTDRDFAGDVDSRKSTFGVFFFLNTSPITWQSNNQSQALWLSRVLGELEGGEIKVPTLLVDNLSVVALIKNPGLSGPSKHIEVKYHLVRESAEQGKIEVMQVRTDDQLGNILTKMMGWLKFQEMRSRIDMVDANIQ